MIMPWSVSGELVKFLDCQVLYPNFEGQENIFTREGDRSFCIAVSPWDANVLIEREVIVKDSERGFYVKIRIPNGHPAVQWYTPLNIEAVLSPWQTRERSGVSVYLNRVL